MCPVFLCFISGFYSFQTYTCQVAGAYGCVCRYLAIANRLFLGMSDHILRPTKHETPRNEQVSRFLYIGQNVS